MDEKKIKVNEETITEFIIKTLEDKVENVLNKNYRRRDIGRDIIIEENSDKVVITIYKNNDE